MLNGKMIVLSCGPFQHTMYKIYDNRNTKDGGEWNLTVARSLYVRLSGTILILNCDKLRRHVAVLGTITEK